MLHVADTAEDPLLRPRRPGDRRAIACKYSAAFLLPITLVAHAVPPGPPARRRGRVAAMVVEGRDSGHGRGCDLPRTGSVRLARDGDGDRRDQGHGDWADDRRGQGDLGGAVHRYPPTHVLVHEPALVGVGAGLRNLGAGWGGVAVVAARSGRDRGGGVPDRLLPCRRTYDPSVRAICGAAGARASRRRRRPQRRPAPASALARGWGCGDDPGRGVDRDVCGRLHEHLCQARQPAGRFGIPLAHRAQGCAHPRRAVAQHPSDGSYWTRPASTKTT